MNALAEQYADTPGQVTSISEDGASESYAVNSVNLALNDAFLRETEYGREFLSMRQNFISI